MRFLEQIEGEYRIYAGALEGPRGDGYIAALVVNQVAKTAPMLREVFRDDSLSCGHRWASADAALAYAMARAREVIRKERSLLTCDVPRTNAPPAGLRHNRASPHRPPDPPAA